MAPAQAGAGGAVGPPARQRTVGGSALGRRGEDAAADFLVGLGYRIVDRNWRCRFGEIDLIARIEHNGRRKIIFCEVKTRAGLGWGDPLEAITYAKRKRLRRLAGHWLATTKEHADDLRMDAIGVMLLPGMAPQVKHVPGID
jgi:putative endonuclease